MKLLIALPALNEEEALPGVLNKLPSALPGVDELQILVVNDGSTDRTAEIAVLGGASVINHPHSRGVGGAFHTAVREALRRGVDALVTIDADGQFDPGDIQRLMVPVRSGEADFVTGSRFSEKRRPRNMPSAKYWGNQMLVKIVRYFTGTGLSDASCGFRVYSREALLNLNLFGKFTYTHETILDLAFKGLRLTEAPVTVRYFDERKSRVARSLFRYAVDASMIIIRTARDFKPMRFFGVTGLAVFILGLILDLWLFVYWLRTGSFSPYKVIGFAGATLNAGGLLIAGLGLLADMLDRMRVNQERLLYFHKKQICDSQQGAGPDAPSTERGVLPEAERR